MTMLKPHIHILLLIFAFALFGVSVAAEAQPTVSFDLGASDLLAAESGQDTAEFTITRSNDGNTAASLDVYVEIGGSAGLNADYAATNLNWGGSGCCTYFIRIPANQLSRIILLTPVLDNREEGEENITFTLLDPLSAGNDYTKVAPLVAEASISDDVAEVILSVNDGTAAEAGQNTAEFTITRNSQGNTAASLDVYVEIGGTAALGTDYAATNLNWGGSGCCTYFIRIPANQLSRIILLTPVLDNREEGEENITFTLLDPLSAGNDYTKVAPLVAEASISDDVAEVILSVNDGTAAEAGQNTAEFTITRNSQGNTAASLDVYVEIGGTAALGTDYAATNLNWGGHGCCTYFIRIPANQLSRIILLTPVLDNREEGEENITFTLLDPLSAGNDYTKVAPLVAEASISDDVAEVILSVNDGTAAEAGQNTAEFTITRNSQGNTAASLDVYVEIGGTAALGTDYAATNLNWGGSGCCTYFIRIPANQLSRTILLTPVLNEELEDEENITFTLLNPLSAGHDYTLGSPSVAEAIILDFRDVIFRNSFE